MMQDFNTTVGRLIEAGGVPGGEAFVPRMCDTLYVFGVETGRDMKLPDWRCQLQGGLNAGYILALLGHSEEAVAILGRSLRIHREFKGPYSERESEVLEFLVSTLKKFGVAEEIIGGFARELEAAKEREKEHPRDIRRKILHIDADLECAEGDLDIILSHGRREQGLLYQRLGDHDAAIRSFRLSIEEDPRDWRKETTLKNTLSIIDSKLSLGSKEAALAEFLKLLKALGPTKIERGEKLPDLFIDNFQMLHPYFAKVGLEGSLASIAEYAAARLAALKPKDHWERQEVCKLTEILAVHYVSQGDYRRASEVFDAGRKHLEYKHHLSRIDQAEYALRAGDPDKARELIAQDDLDRSALGMEREERAYERASLELQMGDFASALDRLDGHCKRYKASLVSGSYEEVFTARRAEIDIMRGVIGQDYLQKVREHLKSGPEFRLWGDIKMLEAPRRSDRDKR